MDIKYIAGLFDGEGYVGVIHNRHANGHVLAVTITNTSSAAFPGLNALYPGAITSSKGGMQRYCFTWRLNGPYALRFLQDIAPHVIIKKDQVDLALTFPVGRVGLRVTPEVAAKRADIYLRLKELKRVPMALESVGVRRIIGDDVWVQRAVSLYRDGMTAEEVADELNLKAPTVSYWLRQTGAMRDKGEAVRAGVMKRWVGYHDQPVIQEAARLYKEGMSPTAISKKLKRKPSTINAWVRKLGIVRTLSESAKLRCAREKNE